MVSNLNASHACFIWENLLTIRIRTRFTFHIEMLVVSVIYIYLDIHIVRTGMQIVLAVKEVSRILTNFSVDKQIISSLIRDDNNCSVWEKTLTWNKFKLRSNAKTEGSQKVIDLQDDMQLLYFFEYRSSKNHLVFYF